MSLYIREKSPQDDTKIKPLWGDVIQETEVDDETGEIFNIIYTGKGKEKIEESDESKSDISSDDEVEEDLLFKGESSYRSIQPSIEIDTGCLCKEPNNTISALSLLRSVQYSNLDMSNSTCILDNLSRSMRVILKSEDIAELTAGADLFYKARHELCFKAFCLAYNIPQEHSDEPFSKYGIDSNRTPDLIYKQGDQLVIIEITAMASYDRAAQSKGIEGAGYESKYQQEINELIQNGLNVNYIVIFFNMSDSKHKIDQDVIAVLDTVFKRSTSNFSALNLMNNRMSMITLNLRNMLSYPSSMLFSNWIDIKPQHKDHEFLYSNKEDHPKISYQELRVSPLVYSKVKNSWNRLSYLIDNYKWVDNGLYIFVLNTVTNKFSIERNQEGLTEQEITKVVENQTKIDFFKNLKLRASGVLIDSTSSEGGILYNERVIQKNSRPEDDNMELLMLNHPAVEYTGYFDTGPYQKFKKQHGARNMYSSHYDPYYEDVLLKAIMDSDDKGHFNDSNKFKGLLGNSKTSEIKIDDIMECIKDEYLDSNTNKHTTPIMIFKTKSPFTIPLANISSMNYSSINDKNTLFYNEVLDCIAGSDPYTHVIIKNLLNPDFTFRKEDVQESKCLRDMNNERYNLSNEMNKLQKEYVFDIKNSKDMNKTLKVSRTSDPRFLGRYQELRDGLRECNKIINSQRIKEGFTDRTSLLRLPATNKLGKKRIMSGLSNLFSQEMQHFKNKKVQSTIEGVGIRISLDSDFEMDKTVFDNISNLLMEYKGKNPDMLIDTFVSEDVLLLKDLKKAAISEYEKVISEVKDSYLGHSAAFVSRLAHSLLYYSQQPFNSDYIKVDNLGYNNVLLIVKGGKKIFKSKNSKLYRVLYPISNELLPWYQIGDRVSSTKIFRINNSHYILTPWSMMHESVLTDSLSFYTRACTFTVLNLNPRVSIREQFHKVSLNILLSFHNRRQTEVLLANMRYILLSTLGDYTGVQAILPEFFGFNYDCFQSFIRTSILVNYPNYFKTLSNLKSEKTSNRDINLSDYIECHLKNIFTGAIINNVEDLALMIYSTFLMTKAPYQRIAERARNLRGILKIHKEYDESVGLTTTPIEQLQTTDIRCEGNLPDYCSSLFQNDFNIDSKFCALVGRFLNSYLVNKGLHQDLQIAWINIMSSTWDEMATSTGLRGDFHDLNDFWGKKGYFVIYKKVLQDIDSRNEMVKLLSCTNLTDDERRKMLRGLNQTFLMKEDSDRQFLIFHAVDKVQWRGGREIYVMDLFTKSIQQPIERYMAHICKHLDNELISIPSDRRAQVIHHSIFEKDLPSKDNMVWYLTLDCTKWAPKSVFSKFNIMLLNMDIIPDSFKVHFLNYSSRLYNKKVYFNKGEVEAVKNNLNYKDISNYLIEDQELNGYYLPMPYSWVMGIFNYTSSLLHAANQKYISYLLTKSSLDYYNEDNSLVMFAHSDDSGGRLTVSSAQQATRSIILYEIFLKSCNHTLSKKKCVISRIYFEILSIIYIFKRLLALLPKFLGGLRFLPTDKGAAQDIMQSYSKSIEVMVSGANFNVAYLVMKFYATMVWRFYMNRKPLPDDYNRPTQYIGFPDSHPLMLLLCGSDADILRITTYNEDGLIRLMTFVNSMLKTIGNDGSIKPIKFDIKVRNVTKGFDDFIKIFSSHLERWSIKNVNYHNTVFNTLSFLSKLSDPGFVGGLANESTVRRISRCYYLRHGNSVGTRLGDIKLKHLMDAFAMVQSYSDEGDVLKGLLFDILEENEILKIKEEFSLIEPLSRNQLNVIKKTLTSPLKVCNYLDMISLQDRQINISYRTLKPTHLQLIKSNKSFSTKFDPASLVSYIKEEDLRWGLKSVLGLKGASEELIEILESLNLDIDTLNCDDLLKICRTFSTENVRDIYLYSRVPGEIRQIKTYPAFLSFLSVNTFDDREISGLVLKLTGKDVARDYVDKTLDDDVYQVSLVLNIITVILTKLNKEFVLNLSIKRVDQLEWEGGNISDFIKHINKVYQNHFGMSYILMLLHHLCIRLDLPKPKMPFNHSSFYTFPKSQRAKSGWFGKGEIYISSEGRFISFKIENTELVSAFTNNTSKIPNHFECYITDVLLQNGLSFSNSKIRVSKQSRNTMMVGFDNLGHLSVNKPEYIVKGIPVLVVGSRGDIDKFLIEGEVGELSRDSFLIKTSVKGENIYKKFYTLPTSRMELLPAIKRLLDPKDFKDKLDTMGLDDFEDFLYTEVLTEYGSELYVNYEDFLDNYQASRTYQIMRKCRIDGISELPTDFVTSSLPAPPGSITRLLVDYTNFTNDKILKIPKSLDSRIMRLRSEYPEQFVTILSEKMVECHSKIYSKQEQKEVSDCYHKITSTGDYESFKQEVVKLMVHWGYGALINSIENYSLERTPKNYLYFNCNITEGGSMEVYDKAYIDLMGYIYKTFMEFSFIYKGIDKPFKNIGEDVSLQCLIINKAKEDIHEMYDYKSLNMGDGLYTLLFNNILLGYLGEEDFVASLQLKMNGNYLLGSILVDYKNRYNFIVLINNLRDCWSRSNTCKFKLDYSLKNQRLPINVQHFKSYLKTFDLETTPADSYYGGFLNDQIMGFIKSSESVPGHRVDYKVTTGISRLSKVAIPCDEECQFDRPIKTDVLDADEWDDLCSEFGLGELDLDTVNDLLDQIGDPYMPKRTKTVFKKGRKVIHAPVRWVIMPYFTCSTPISRFIRQIHENVILLTNSYIPGLPSLFPNSGYRIVNYCKDLTDVSKPMLVFYTLSSELNNKEFLDGYIGGQPFSVTSEMEELLKIAKIRDVDGVVKDSFDTGLCDPLEHAIGQIKHVYAEDGTVRPVNVDDEPDEDEEIKPASSVPEVIDDNESAIRRAIEINKLIDRMSSERGLSDECVNKIKKKYNSKSILRGLSNDIILRSLANEIDLNGVAVSIQTGELNLTREEHSRAFQGPYSLMPTYQATKSVKDPVTDNKLRAELNSKFDEMSRLALAGVKGISKKMIKVAKANYGMWMGIVKNANVKKDSKYFGITCFLGEINSFGVDEVGDYDKQWQDYINKLTIYITEEITREDSDTVLGTIFDREPSSRIKYLTEINKPKDYWV